MTAFRRSWVESANSAETEFPLNKLPYGVFSTDGSGPRCGVAIGDQIVDVTALEEAATLTAGESPVFARSSWNAFMELGPEAWAEFRDALTALLTEGSTLRMRVEPCWVPARFPGRPGPSVARCWS